MSTVIKHLDRDGATQIASESWGIMEAGAAAVAQKFAVENISDRVLGTTAVVLTLLAVPGNDGFDFALCALDTATLSKPYGVGAALSGTGGMWGTPKTVYYRITTINATGETIGSDEITVIVSDADKKVDLSWTKITGATNYKVYRSETAGIYTTPALRATVAQPGGAGPVTYTDDGDSLSAGAPPAANTTGGAAPNYGTPPTMGAGPLSLPVLAIAQQAFYWVQVNVPSYATSAGNDRLFKAKFTEA